MRSTRAKVVKGKINEPQPEIELDEGDLKALDDAIAATHEGKLVSWETLRASLRSE